MGLFDFFKKKKKKVVYRISIFDDETYPYSRQDFENHRRLFDSLTYEQKCAMLYPIGFFYKTFMLEETWQFAEGKDLCAQREVLLGISFDEARETLMNLDDILNALISIENKEITDILLRDMKFLLVQLVGLNLRLADGAEVNQLAIEFLYSLFLPLGYDAKQVYNARDFIMF